MSKNPPSPNVIMAHASAKKARERKDRINKIVLSFTGLGLIEANQYMDQWTKCYQWLDSDLAKIEPLINKIKEDAEYSSSDHIYKKIIKDHIEYNNKMIPYNENKLKVKDIAVQPKDTILKNGATMTDKELSDWKKSVEKGSGISRGDKTDQELREAILNMPPIIQPTTDAHTHTHTLNTDPINNKIIEHILPEINENSIKPIEEKSSIAITDKIKDLALRMHVACITTFPTHEQIKLFTYWLPNEIEHIDNIFNDLKVSNSTVQEQVKIYNEAASIVMNAETKKEPIEEIKSDHIKRIEKLVDNLYVLGVFGKTPTPLDKKEQIEKCKIWWDVELTKIEKMIGAGIEVKLIKEELKIINDFASRDVAVNGITKGPNIKFQSLPIPDGSIFYTDYIYGQQPAISTTITNNNSSIKIDDAGIHLDTPKDLFINGKNINELYEKKSTLSPINGCPKEYNEAIYKNIPYVDTQYKKETHPYEYYEEVAWMIGYNNWGKSRITVQEKKRIIDENNEYWKKYWISDDAVGQGVKVEEHKKEMSSPPPQEILDHYARMDDHWQGFDAPKKEIDEYWKSVGSVDRKQSSPIINDLTKAGYRIVASQISDITASSISTIIPEDKVQPLHDFLSSDFGKGTISLLLGLGLTHTSENERVLKLAKELRVGGITVFGNTAVEEFVEMIGQVVKEAVEDIKEEPVEEMIMDEDIELDSPNFVPDTVKELEERNYERINR